MSPRASPSGGVASLVELAEPTTPVWVHDLLHGAADRPPSAYGDLPTSGHRFSSVGVAVSGVEQMDVLAFQDSVTDAYRAIFERLSAVGTFPIRFWAFIPRIHATYGKGLDRYMAFNMGRFAAHRDHWGGPDGLSGAVPTASAVGRRAGDLVIHCLASDPQGIPVENPRQVPAYSYSSRFGPLPPCFSRATLLKRKEGPPLLFVGGTASIRGEDSVHRGELALQTLETFHNLASVVRSGCLGSPSSPESPEEVSPWLGLFRELRVYYRETRHRRAIVEMVGEHFHGLRRIETIRAELCRPELLVEIEGLAEVPARS